MSGPLIIVSGPSGSGKSTVVARLLRECGDPPLRAAISATTRTKRPGETDGVDYHFWTREQFEQGLLDHAFLEWARVHDQYYGTLRSEVTPWRAQGCGVVLVIDVQGAAQVRRSCPDAISIFLLAPTEEELERRLRSRGTEDESSIRRRLEAARRETARSGEYNYQIVNDDVARTATRLCEIIRSHAR